MAALINAAFRLPYSSIEFLYNRLLEDNITDEALLKDIEWRSSYQVFGPAPSVFSNNLPPEVVSVQSDSVASFPYRYSHAQSYIGEPPLGEHLPLRTVLVGDAAHSMHPLAGQGLNTGLADAESLANSLETALCHGQDPGSVLALRQYSRERYLANHLLMSGIDHLHSLYGTQAGLAVWTRSMGLEVVNESSLLRSFFMNRAGAVDPSDGRSSLGVSALATAVQAGTTLSTLFARGVNMAASRLLTRNQEVDSRL